MDLIRIRGALGLAVRARQTTFGEDGCLKSIRNGDCALLLVDDDASDATADKYRSACDHYNTTLRVMPPGLIGEATGRPGMAVAIRPGGLADQLLNLTAEADDPYSSMMRRNNSGGASVE